ncbi:serpin B6-like [Ornithodoros turicata]|uniref:serpin B6-like n=1 Tax=Ornithodoros turicata TaxID=34597 RepID=UPI0031386610
MSDPSAEALAHFGFSLFTSVARDRIDHTTMVCPAAVAAQLCTLQMAVSGETKAELLSTPVLHGQISYLQAATVKLLVQFGKPSSNFQAFLVHRVYIDRTVQLVEGWSNAVETMFKCGVEPAAFRGDPEAVAASANAWIAQATDGHLTTIVPPGTIDTSEKVMLVSAFYFKSPTEHAFQSIGLATYCPKASVRLEVDMIGATGEFMYAELTSPASGKALVIPFRHCEVSLLLLLPDRHSFVNDYRAGLTPSFLKEVLDKLTRKQVHVELPRTTFTQEINLNRSLITLGVKHAFMESADFSAAVQVGALRLTNVMQKVVFVLQENPGTKPLELPSAPLDFLVCRPFLLVLYRPSDNYILLLGAVKDIPK